MAASTIAVNLSGVTGNVYAQAGMNTVYTNVPQNDTVNILVGSEVAAIQLTNPYYTTDTTTGFHVLQNIEVQDSYANYKVWSYYGNVTLTNKLTGQLIQFQLTKPLPGANNSGVNVEFLDGALAYTANVSRNGIWTTWITKGDTGTSTWGTNSVASPFTAATALDQTLLGSSGTNTVNQAINSSDVNDWYGIEPSWFSSEYYLFSKQAELAAQGVTITIPELEAAITEAGFTPYTHYLAFSTEELTDPNEYFSTLQVLEGQAAVTGLTVAEVQAEFEAAGFTNAYDWWAQYGWTNGINPSNDFNDEAYLEAKAMASGLTIAEVQQAFIDAGLTPLQHYLQFGLAEGLEATPVYLGEQVAWQYSTALSTTAGQAVVGSEVSEQFTAVASPLSRSNTLHATDTIDGLGGINTLTVDMQQNFAGFSAGKGLTNIQNVQLINADAGIARTYTATGSEGVENYALAGEVNLASQGSVANVVAQDRLGALSLTYTTAVTAGTSDQLNLTTINVANDDAAVTVTAAGIETLQLDTHGVNILNLSGVANATKLVLLGDGVTDITGVGAAVKAVDAAYASGDLTLNLSGASGVTSVITGTGENHIQADLTANSGQLAKNAVITGNGTIYDELLLTNVGGSGTTTVQYTMTGVEGLAFGNIGATAVTYSAKNTTGLQDIEIQATFAINASAQVVNLGAVDMEVQLQGDSKGSVLLDNAGVTLVATEGSTSAISISTGEVNETSVTLNNATALNVYVDEFTSLSGDITAAKATSVAIEIDGELGNTITASAATGVTFLQNSKTISSTLNLAAAAATSLEVISEGTLTLSSAFTDLGNLQTLIVDTAQSFTLYKDIAAANSVTFSGAGDVTLMNVGATTNGYSLTVDASDLDGDLTTGNLAVGTGQNINLNLSTLGGTAMIGSGFSDALTATTGAVDIDASEALGAIEVGNILAKNVTVDTGGSLGAFQAGLIAASSGVTYVGTELFANSVDIEATGTSLTVAITGGLGNDNIEVDGGATTSKITLTGDLGLGDNALSLDALSSATVGINMTYAALYNYDTAAVTGSTLADTITAGSGNDTIAGGAAADNLSGGNGDNVFQYGNGEFIAAETVTGGSGTDTVLFTADSQTVADSAFTNKTLIEAITTANGTNSITLGVNATAATSNLTVTGGSGADRIDASAMTKALTIIGNAGNDTLLGGVGNDTIAAGIDLDSIAAGAGADLVTLTVDSATDSITQGVADGVASTANTLIAGQAIAAGQSMTFGNGLDVITHFLAGAGGDVLTVDFNTAQSILGQTSSNIGVSGYLSGTYANGTFTVASNGAGPDTLIVQVGGGANLANNSNTSVLLLQGVDSSLLRDANFGGAINLTADFSGTSYAISGTASALLSMNAVTGVLSQVANYTPGPFSFDQTKVTTIDFSQVTAANGVEINVDGSVSSALASIAGTSASDFIIEANEDMGAALTTVNGGGGIDTLAFSTVGAAGVSLTQTAGGGNLITSIEEVRLAAGSVGTVTLADSITTVVEVYNDSGTNAATVVLGSGASHSYTNGSGTANNDVTIREAGQNVTVAGGDDTVRIDLVGGFSGALALGSGVNTVTLENGGSLAGATTSISSGGTWGLTLADNASVTLRAANLIGANATSGISAGAAETVSVNTTSLALTNYALDSDVETWNIGVVGNGNNSVTLGAAGQSATFGSGDDTVVVGTLAATGNLALDGGFNNVVRLGNGGSLAGATITRTGVWNLWLDTGASATVRTDNLIGANNLFLITGAGSETLTVNTSGAALTGYTLSTAVESWNIGTVGNGNNSVTLGAIGQSAAFGTGNDTIVLGLNGTSGTYDMGAGTNVVSLASGISVSASNVSATGGTYSLNLLDDGNPFSSTIKTAMLQNATGITTTGGGTTQLSVDTTGSGFVNKQIDVDLDQLTIVAGTSANSITLLGTTQSFTGGAGDDTVTLGALAATGTLNGGAGANTLTLGGGTLGATIAGTISNFGILNVTANENISQANGGAAIGATTLTMANSVTLDMTADQNTGLQNSASVAGTGQEVRLFSAGTTIAIAGIESYNLGGAGANQLNINRLSNNVNIGGNAGNVSTVAIDGTGASTFTGTFDLQNGSDVISATNSADISGINKGAVTTAENLSLVGEVTMTADQYDGFTGITAGGVADSITFTDALTGAAGLNANVETFVFANTNTNSVTTGANSQTLNANALSDGNALTLTGTHNVAVSLVAGDLTANTATGDLTVTATTGTNVIATGSGADTITGGDAADNLSGGSGNNIYRYGDGEFIPQETVTGGAGSDTILFTSGNQTVLSTAFLNKTSLNAVTFDSGINEITLGAEAAAALSNATITGGSGQDTIDVDNAGWDEAFTVIGGAGNDLIKLKSFGVARQDVVVLGTVTAAGADSVYRFDSGVDRFKFASGTSYYESGAVTGGNLAAAETVAITIARTANPNNWDTTGDVVGFTWEGSSFAMINGNDDTGFSNNTDAIVLLGSGLSGLSTANFIA